MILTVKPTKGLTLLGMGSDGELQFEVSDPSAYRGLLWLQTAEKVDSCGLPSGVLATKVVKVGPKGGIGVS